MRNNKTEKGAKMNTVDIIHAEQKGFLSPQYQIIVDGILLNDFLNGKTSSNDFDLLVPPVGLMYEQEQRKILELLNMRNVVLPLLVCSDDMDFSCIIVSVFVAEKKNQTIWEHWGYGLNMSKPIFCPKLAFDSREYKKFAEKFKNYIEDSL